MKAVYMLARDIRRAERARYAGKMRRRELEVKRAEWEADRVKLESQRAKWAACPNHGLVASHHESVRKDDTVADLEVINVVTKPQVICWECKSGWLVVDRNYTHP